MAAVPWVGRAVRAGLAEGEIEAKEGEAGGGEGFGDAYK